MTAPRSAMKKRSIALGRHATSVSLEDAFWDELKRMAGEAGITVAKLVEQIDRQRDTANLSSALRLAVLEDLRALHERPVTAPRVEG